MNSLINVDRPFYRYINYLLGFGLTFAALSAMAGTVSQSPLFLTSTVKPNIMLMMDNSISMGNAVISVTGGTLYDATKTYPQGYSCPATALPANGDTDSQTNCTATGIGSWTGTPKKCVISYSTTVPNSFYGKKVSSTTGTQCFLATKDYKGKSSINSTLLALMPITVTTTAQVANWLNWYYQNELAKVTVTDTRMNIVKKSATSLVNSLGDQVRLGFSTFNADNGGKLFEVVNDLTAVKKKNITDRIALTTNDSSTPLAETLVTLGRYFAGNGTTGNVTLHADNAALKSTVAKTAVLPVAIADGTTWTPRTAITGESIGTSPIQARCQKSFNVVMTDGLPSSDQGISTNTYLADYDGDCSGSNSINCGVKSGTGFTTPHYDMKRLYNYPGTCNNAAVACVDNAGSSSSDYFDDVSQALYQMDLRPDLRVPAKESATSRNNLTTFVVGFADNAINPTIPGVNPLPRDAAIQGGGKFFFAGSEGELTASLLRTFQYISENVSASSSVAANSAQLQTNTILFQAVFNSANWSGDVKAFNLTSEDTNGNGTLDPGEDSNGNGVLDFGLIDPVPRWLASERIPADTERHIFTYDASAKIGLEFQWDKLSTAQKQVLDALNATKTGISDSLVFNFLRGDQDNEGTLAGKYRQRSTVLGDIINSDPLFVSADDFGYAALPEGSSTYGKYVSDKKNNSEMLYVGANDGMLHALMADFSPPSGVQEGQEIFAYVPNTVISPELATLTDRAYVHRYFVDGAPQYGDAFFGGQWHSVLVGSMGSGRTTASGGATGTGGVGLFALDITKPDSFDKNSVLWEFSNRNDVDLGYTLAIPSVARMANGSWAAIVGNGYSDTTLGSSGKAVLFILNIQTGAVIKKIVAEQTTLTNGLSSTTPVDVDGDKIIDYIYAGDLKGNLWKFDVTSNDPNLWKVAYNASNPCNPCTPLFVATDSAATPARQIITAKPAIIKAKANEQTSGVMVYFGTGKYYEDGDHQVPNTNDLAKPLPTPLPPPQVQTFYGIWDVCDKTTSATCNGVVSGRSLLVEQKLVDEISDLLRITTNCEVPYGSTLPSTSSTLCPMPSPNRRGWFMDLKSPVKGAEGERAVSTPIVRNNTIVFTTLIPINITCDPGGTGWFMEMDINGARFNKPVVDINGDGKIDINDNYFATAGDKQGVVVTGLKSKEGIIESPTIVGGADCLEYKFLNSTSGTIKRVKETKPETCGAPTPPQGSRMSWRQLR